MTEISLAQQFAVFVAGTAPAPELLAADAQEVQEAADDDLEGVDETADGHPIVWRSAPGTIYVGENLDATPSEDEEAELSPKETVFSPSKKRETLQEGKVTVRRRYTR